MVSNGFRDCYEPATGRYCQPDPMGQAAGPSLYAYANEDPLGATDPTGLCLSKKCSKALAAIHKTAKAVERANENWNTIISAAADNGIDPALLAAIGVRESGFENIDQKGGSGKGVFQIDIGRNPQIPGADAENVTYAANWAAAQLTGNYAYFSQNRPSFTQDQLLQATAAAYNEGRGNVGRSPGTIQKDSRNHYGQNVLDLMDCFSY